MKKALLTELITSLLILLYVYTGVSKLIGYRRFTIVLEQFPFLKSWSHPVGWLLPVTELIVALMLFFHSSRRVGLWLSLFLLTCFTVFLVGMVATTPELPCNCGGVLEQLSWPQHIAFNTTFLLLNAWALKVLPGERKQEKESP